MLEYFNITPEKYQNIKILNLILIIIKIIS